MRAFDRALKQRLLERLEIDSAVEHRTGKIAGLGLARCFETAAGVEVMLWSGRRGAAEEQVLHFDQSIDRRKNDAAFKDVLQFPDVARPVVGLEGEHGFVADASETLVVKGFEAPDHGVHQGRDVARTLPQRWNCDRIDVESVIEVAAESPGGNRLLQIDVGRSNQADIDLACPLVSQALDFALLQHAQQFCLGGKG